jgi:preprotein translocase subunit SecB
MPMQQQTPLDIESYYVRELHLKTNLDFDDDKPATGELDVDYDVLLHPDDPLRFQVGLSVAVGFDEQRTNEPYSLLVVIHGFFRFMEGTDDETKSRMMFSNAVPIMYGIARGCVGQATGTGFYGPLMLPPFNFVKLAQDKAQRESDAQPKPLPAPTPETAKENPSAPERS